jgi:hypothetical protein
MARPISIPHVVLGSIAFSCAVIACGEEAPPPEIDTTPIVGTLEVPISHRHDGTAPSDALRIEANQAELRLGSQTIYTLERGRIPSSEITESGPTKLQTAIAGSPARGRASILAHGLVGYGTIARSVQALLGAGYREISFAVRPLSTTGAPPTAVSWLSLSAPQVAPPGPAPVDPATYGGTQRPWRDFTSTWEEVYQACRAGRYVDCDPAPLATPEDGSLQVVLWARGQGMQIRFNRVGAPPPEDPAAAAAAGPAMIEGVQAERAGAGEEVPPTPAVTGAFSFRAEVATAEDSAISAAMRPVCGAGACQVVIEADETTPIMRVISLLGAAFPDGSTPPQVIFRIPERD